MSVVLMCAAFPLLGGLLGLTVHWFNHEPRPKTPKPPKAIEAPKKTQSEIYLEHCIEQDRLFNQGDKRGIYGDYMPQELQ